MTCGAIGSPDWKDCPECRMPLTRGETGGHKMDCTQHPRERATLPMKREDERHD